MKLIKRISMLVMALFLCCTLVYGKVKVDAAASVSKVTSALATDGSSDGVYIMTAVSDDKEYYVPNAKATKKGAVLAKSFKSTNLSDDMYWTFTYNSTSSSWEIKSNASTSTESLYLNFINENTGVRVNTNKSNFTILKNENDTTFTLSANVGTTTTKRNLAMYNSQDWRCYGNLDNGVPAINLYQVSFVEESAEQEAANTVNPTVSLGFTYTVSSSLQDCKKEMAKQEVTSGRKILIVSSYNGAYYAMNDDFTATQLTLDETGKVTTTLENKSIWLVEEGSTAGKLSFKNASTNEYLGTTTSTTIVLKDTKVDLDLVSDDKGLYINLTDNRTLVYRDRDIVKGFKAYDISNIGSNDYAAKVHIFAYDVAEVKTYTDVEFRVRCGADSTSLSSLATYSSYGIFVKELNNPLKTEPQVFGAEETYKFAVEGDKSYITITLGDILNNPERATTLFSTGAYVTDTNVNYHYATNVKEFSIASLIQQYVEEQNIIDEAVIYLYDLFSALGYYAK